MRTIKFRGQRIDNGEWVYGDLYQEKESFKGDLKLTMIVEYRPDLRLVSGAPSHNHWWREVSPATVGQFTGLQDKNGVDIYEGDIFTLGSDAIYEVKFADGCFMAFRGNEQFGLVGELIPTHIRVIGNIHEHKHLLS